MATLASSRKAPMKSSCAYQMLTSSMTARPVIPPRPLLSSSLTARSRRISLRSTAWCLPIRGTSLKGTSLTESRRLVTQKITLARHHKSWLKLSFPRWLRDPSAPLPSQSASLLTSTRVASLLSLCRMLNRPSNCASGPRKRSRKISRMSNPNSPGTR